MLLLLFNATWDRVHSKFSYSLISHSFKFICSKTCHSFSPPSISTTTSQIFDLPLLSYGINMRKLLSKGTPSNHESSKSLILSPPSQPSTCMFSWKLSLPRPIFFQKPFPCGLKPTMVNHAFSSMPYFTAIILL